jgi:peroxiredoxin Q/BCP
MRVPAKIGLAVCLLGLGALVGGGWLAAEARGQAKAGAKAPNFTATDDQGKPWKLSDHVGKKIVVLYFYPADFTGGCTAQACGFRDNIDKLAGNGIEVVGISGDSAKTHGEFKRDQKLPFTLLADEDGTIAKEYGVPTRKGGNIPRRTSRGKSFNTPQDVVINRYTVIIDRNGNIAALYAVGNPAQDSQKVLETVQKQAK